MRRERERKGREEEKEGRERDREVWEGRQKGGREGGSIDKESEK
jgi:hypothetical protein